MTDNPELVHVGWYCWRCEGLVQQPCRSDSVPVSVPAEWAADMEAEIRRLGDEGDEPASPVVPAPATDQGALPLDRPALSAKLWEIAEHHIAAEWICCEPLEPRHDLCAKGYAALGMAKTLVVDSPEAWNPNAPLLDAILAMLPAPADRVALIAQAVRACAEHLRGRYADTWTTDAARSLDLNAARIERGEPTALLRRMAAESAPATAPLPVRHAPGKAVLCPDCRDKGHAVCMGAEQTAAAQQPKEARP